MDIIVKFKNKSLPRKKFKNVESVMEDGKGRKALSFKDPELCDVIFLPNTTERIIRE